MVEFWNGKFGIFFFDDVNLFLDCYVDFGICCYVGFCCVFIDDDYYCWNFCWVDEGFLRCSFVGLVFVW